MLILEREAADTVWTVWNYYDKAVIMELRGNSFGVFPVLPLAFIKASKTDILKAAKRMNPDCLQHHPVR